MKKALITGKTLKAKSNEKDKNKTHGRI